VANSNHDLQIWSAEGCIQIGSDNNSPSNLHDL